MVKITGAVKEVWHWISEAKARIKEVLNAAGGPCLEDGGPAFHEAVEIAWQAGETVAEVLEEAGESGFGA
jgi:hypothetical protein